MDTITKEKVQKAISDFLDKKSGLTLAREKHKKANDTLVKEKTKNSPDPVKIKNAQERVEAALKEIEKCEEIRAVKFDKNIWIEEKIRAAKNFKFATHISKGIHPDSKGDCINFKSSNKLPQGLIASQALDELQIDGSGNAGALPLLEFINIDISGVKLKDLILNNSPLLSGIFSTEKQKSEEHLKFFEERLKNVINKPETYELNKQLLWPLSESAISDNDYICLVPLYPSSFTHSFYNSIIDKFYSEENKNARYGKTDKPTESVALVNSAITKLGGSNPRNVSKFVNSRRGKDFLLPSLPPVIDKSKKYSITKRQKTIFNRTLQYHCKDCLNELFKVVKVQKNNVDVRNMRKEAADMILYELLFFAETIQKSWISGWSRDFDILNESEKLWLDPKRTELEGEEEFLEKRSSKNWKHEIMDSFALWLNQILQKRFKKLKQQFGKAEYNEWLREIEDAIKTSLSNGEEVFR